MDWNTLLNSLPEKPEIVLGIDEVGFGALAGPLVVSVVAVPVDWSLDGLRDSKQLQRDKRERLDKHLLDFVVLEGICSASEIDKRGARECLISLHSRAIEEARRVFPDAPVFVDGNLPLKNAINVVKADTFIPAVMAASVHAKVYRDRMMLFDLDKKYPLYGFGAHKGYGTLEHYRALSKYGICDEHRRSFLSFYDGNVVVPEALRANL